MEMIRTRSIRGPWVELAVAASAWVGVSLGEAVWLGPGAGAPVAVGAGAGGAAHPAAISTSHRARVREDRFREPTRAEGYHAAAEASTQL
ncbi:MAG: hypothetical protein A2Z66_07020 [Chloroflexi bacterium RBG_13_66_10]|nr:MAG: hypothetical protein A2Z66_07020 [Chloroflexi bacterium RBG_13_66_10]